MYVNVCIGVFKYLCFIFNNNDFILFTHFISVNNKRDS